jgi:hypothetical protein
MTQVRRHMATAQDIGVRCLAPSLARRACLPRECGLRMGAQTALPSATDYLPAITAADAQSGAACRRLSSNIFV